MLITILLVLALICFAIPAFRALLRSQLDGTNMGLFLLTLAFLLRQGVIG